MAKRAYCYLLIFSSVLCQEIMASLSVDGKSSNIFVRNKRVINHEPGGDALARFSEINYIVNIREHSRIHCVGAILSPLTVITAPICFLRPLVNYRVLSGSGYSHRSKNHTITSMITHYGNPPVLQSDGVALIKVDPPFTFGQTTENIQLHVGSVEPGTSGLISGWGCHHPTSNPMMGSQKLRSITVPIMNHRECAAAYEGRFAITDKYICTYDELKLCALNDIGTPLVINDSLAGIHIFKGQVAGRRNPDVFLDVRRLDYHIWIQQHILH